MLIVQALVTALLSGLFSGGIVFALNERRERNNLLREKAESAIEAYSDWMETISRWPNAHFDMFRGDREVGRQQVEVIWSDARTKYRRAEALIGLYMPEKRNVLSDGVAAYHGFIEFHGQMGLASINAEVMSQQCRDQISATNTALVNARHEGFQTLITAGRATALAPFLIRLPRRSNRDG